MGLRDDGPGQGESHLGEDSVCVGGGGRGGGACHGNMHAGIAAKMRKLPML